MRLLCLLLSLLPGGLFAQFVAPAASPAASVSTTAGYTDLRVDYHRPNVRGRLIFGELIPYGDVWRAGANGTTVLRLSQPVVIGGIPVLQGEYRLLVIPRRDGAWTWIVNAGDINAWGARDYDAAQDIVRVDAYPRRLPERTESLEYRWRNVRPEGVDLVLEWSWYAIELPIEINTDAYVAQRAGYQLSPAKDPDEYYAIARYYLDRGKTRQAKAWIDRWAAQGEEQFGRLRYRAIIEYELGNERKATRLMTRSLELAREAGNDHYVRMNEQSLRSWQREPVTLPADSIVARSIRHHDPARVWGRRPLELQLEEKRTGANDALLLLTFAPTGNGFAVTKSQGTELIDLRYERGKLQRHYRNQPVTDERTAGEKGLTERRYRQLEQRYTYRYGLPMELRNDEATVNPAAHKVWFNGRECYEVEVRYPGQGAGYVSRLYFDPPTYALAGYARFPETEGPEAGQYVVFENETRRGNLLLPRTRHQYATRDNRYLGTDRILEKRH